MPSEAMVGVSMTGRCTPPRPAAEVGVLKSINPKSPLLPTAGEAVRHRVRVLPIHMTRGRVQRAVGDRKEIGQSQLPEPHLARTGAAIFAVSRPRVECREKGV
jgi:hypothetical protein